MDWLGDGVATIESALRFRVARQGVLAANVANVDTPGYRRADLAFDRALARAGGALRRTDPRHLDAPGAGAPGWRLETGRGPTRPDGNDVSIDRELIALSRNASAFRQESEALSRLFALRQTAMGGR